MTLEQLEKMVKALRGKRRGPADLFVLESGEEFAVDNAVSWLIQYGIETPRGRIVAYQHPESGVDALTLSIYETIDEAIATGGLTYLLEKQ